jgi:anti-sigma factor RsiW
MTVDTETLIAYIDGELDAVTAKRVERAIEADPALRAEMEQHRALTQSLHGAFAPIAQAPVPEDRKSVV